MRTNGSRERRDPGWSIISLCAPGYAVHSMARGHLWGPPAPVVNAPVVNELDHA